MDLYSRQRFVSRQRRMKNFVLSNWTRISLVCLLLPIGFCGWELVTEESILMIPSENKLVSYNEACGMNGNQVNQIVADAYNHIWIDTNQKLIEFNPRNGSFRTYLTTDGSILLHRFLPTAVCQAKMAIFIWRHSGYLHGYSIKRVGKKG